MRSVVARGGTALLALVNLGWGGWAVVDPLGFFRTFPGFGHRWTSAYPPFNDHLVTDLGATFITLGFLLGVGAATADRRLRWLALGATLLFNLLHLSYHATHRGLLGALDYGLSTASLVAGVLAPLALMAVEAARPRTTVAE